MNIFLGDQDALKEKLKTCAEAALAVKKPCFVLVPQMMTLQTEKELLQTLGLSGSFLLQVMSPERLTEKVFESAGMGRFAGRIRVSERGKTMAIASVLHNHRKSLAYYGQAAGKPGLSGGLTALVTTLKQSDVTPEDLKRFVASLPDGAQKMKWEDIGFLYAQYEAILQGGFADGEDVQNALTERLAETDFCRGGVFIFYGFDLLTEQLSRMICAMHKADEVDVLMKTDERDPAYEPVNRSVKRLKERAKNAGCFVSKKTIDGGRPPLPPALRHLRFHALSGRAYAENTENVHFYAGSNPFYELMYIAKEMHALHDAKGVRYGEMALILCPGESYYPMAQAVMEMMNVPVHIPRKTVCLTHPLSRFVLSALSAVSDGFSAQDMLALLRSGYTPLSQDEALTFINYIQDFGIRGKGFERPFDRGNESLCAFLEEPRKKVMEPLCRFRDRLRDAQNAKEALTAVYEYLDENACYTRVMETEESLLSQNMQAEAAVNRQVWNTLIGLMDEIYALFGEDEKKLNARLAVALLRSGMEEARLSALPPKSDCVLAGGIGDLADFSPDTVFIAGMNDGVLQNAEDVFLNDEEKAALSNHAGKYLGLDGSGLEMKTRLDFYAALCMAHRQLYISRAIAEQTGETKRPHFYYQEVRRLFPMLREEGGVQNAEGSDLPYSLAHAADELAERFFTGDLEPNWEDAWQTLLRDAPDYAQSVRSAFVRTWDVNALSREITGRLFLERVMSSSRLETYAACPFKHFVRYGLRPEEAKKWAVNPLDTGNFYHNALEGFTRLLPTIPSWPNISKKECDAAIDRAADEQAEKTYGPLIRDSSRARAAVDNYRRTLRRVAWAFTRGARQSSFRVQGGEIHFGDGTENALPAIPLTLKDGSRVLLRGIIDRVDRYQGDDGVYFRVVDYKSGHQTLDPEKIFYGEQLQLLLYLLAVSESPMGGEPAGAYYFHLHDPLVEEPKNLEELEDKLAEKLTLSGVTLKDAKVIRLMDSGEPPLTLPKMINKDGSIAVNSATLRLEDMHRLIVHAMDTAVKLCESMRTGYVKPREKKENDRSVCQLCEYAFLCRPENRDRVARKSIKWAELLDKISAQEREENI